MAYKSEGFVDVRIARIFNTFGPRMHPDDGRVVSNFVTQSLKGEPLTIYGEGKQTRSFQFVTDLVRGLIALMACDYSMPVSGEGLVYGCVCVSWGGGGGMRLCSVLLPARCG